MTNPAVSTLEDSILDPEPISLPPQRRLMIGLMLALAALLHVATIGWGPIENGPAGFNAAVARELAMGMQYQDISRLWGEAIHPNPVQWLTALSFQMFGINEWAARLPFALANLLIVWMVFLVGDRMGGMWRGLASGMIAATTAGVILHGRDGGGASLTALLFVTTFYVVLRMLEQKSRLRWQVIYWVLLALLLVLEQPVAMLVSLAAPLLAMAFFREARIRLRGRWFLYGSIIFAILAVFLHQMDFWKISAPAMRYKTGLLGIGLLFFPWSVVMVLPFFLQIRKVIRPRTFGVEDVPLWSGASLLFVCSLIMITSTAWWTDEAACLWPVFALISGLVWERATSGMRILGVLMLVVLALAAITLCGRIVAFEWLQLLQPIWWMSCSVIVIFGLSAVVSLKLRHSRAALLTIAASVVPLAFNLLDAQTRYNWQHSMKDLGTKLAGDYEPADRVFVDDSLTEISSFLFYAPHGLHVIQKADALHMQKSPGDYWLCRATVLNPGEIIGRNRTHALVRFRAP